MYADWTNQLAQISRYSFAFIFLMMVCPKFLFRHTGGDLTERIAARFIFMTLLLILLGYLLVITQLLELLAIIPVFCLIAARDNIRHLFLSKHRRRNQSNKVIKLFDWLEGKYNPWPDARAALKRKQFYIISELRQRISQIPQLIETLLILFVVAIAAYIRFSDALINAAPAMSDSYVTLAWIKYIDQRVLFYDGIYPQGFHIWMDFLVKFSFSNPLYILKYTGPLNSILIMAGMHFAVSRWTGSRMAGLFAMAIYGILGSLISGGAFERQASTNSQEFAFVFVIPTLYFLHRWLRDRVKGALLAGIAGMAVIGLVHTLAYVFLGIGVALLLMIYIPLTLREWFRPLKPIIIGGIVSVFISIGVLGIGFMLGRSLHSSSQDFATSRNKFTSLPELNFMDILSLVAIGIIFIWTLWHFRRIREFTGPLVVGLFVTVTFILYYFGSELTFPGSIVITARSTELWALMIPISVGTMVGLLFRRLRSISKSGYLEIGITILFIITIIVWVPPKPIIPYKMEWNSGIEQYLKLSNDYRPKAWMVVSPSREGYSVVLGSAIHMDTATFLQRYDPNKWPLTIKGASDYDHKIPLDVFIYFQKVIFQVNESNAVYPILKPEYETRAIEMEQMEEWMKQQLNVNPKLEINYEDEHLRIYHIHQPMDEMKKEEQIWGK